MLSVFCRTASRLMLLCLLVIPAAWADGTLTHMSGPVSIQRGDGQTVPAQVGLKVQTSDSVITGATGFVRIEMTDGGEMVLRPNSQMKVEDYRFEPAKPAEDKFVFSMLKGGMRTVTGLIGKRGNRDAYELKTVTATIGVRGTQFDLRLCLADCGALPMGTYVAVRFGAIQASNAQGSVPVAAGQVVRVPPLQPPIILPRDPGIGFTPPAVIPKLDERKKPQPAATSGGPAASQPQNASSRTGAGGSGGPATSQRAAASSTSGAATKEGDSGGTSGGSSGSSSHESAGGGGQSVGSPSGTSQSSSSPSSSTPASSGPECVVQ